jgi:hypothetical protein
MTQIANDKLRSEISKMISIKSKRIRRVVVIIQIRKFTPTPPLTRKTIINWELKRVLTLRRNSTRAIIAITLMQFESCKIESNISKR